MKNKLRNIENSLRLIPRLKGVPNIEKGGNDIKALFKEIIVNFFRIQIISLNHKLEKSYEVLN